MLQINQILGQTYQILKPIGQGGAGTIYLAYHLNLQKYVVVKYVPTMAFGANFRQEVDILKGLRHTNIPQVYDFLPANNGVYTIMDYIEGKDMQKIGDENHANPVNRQMVCSAENLIRWYRQLTVVLEYIHGQNPQVVHSDIKPGNIIITPENNAVLIDFNVSIKKAPDTIVGLSLGFASPEQINMMQQKVRGEQSGISLDGRSDIYSLAATFYYMMTGIRPSVFHGTTPLNRMQTGYPEQFCDIIDKALQMDPEDRYQSASEMKRALDNMWKKENGYKAYVAAQFAVVILSGAMLIAGVNRLFTGIHQREIQNYQNEYNQCVQLINSGEASSAISECLNLLNTREKQLDKEPLNKAKIFRGMAQRYMEQADYDSAADYFGKAIELLKFGDPDLLDCYSGMISAYVNEGNVGQAETVLQNAGRAGISSNELMLLQIQMSSIQNNKEECISLVEKLQASTTDASLLAKAYVAAGEVCGDSSSQLGWYRLAARQAVSQTQFLRQLGYDLLLCGNNLIDGNADSGKEALQLSADCYQRILNEKPAEATVNDYLNLATAHRLNRSFSEAIQALRNLENSKILQIDPGLLSMYKAFTYDAQNNTVDSMRELRNAKASVTQSMVSPEEWNQLQLLEKKYGV